VTMARSPSSPPSMPRPAGSWGACQRRHRSPEFVKFLDGIDAAVHRWLAKRPRYHLHFTTSASWLNLVERWFGALTEKQLRQGVFRSTRELEAAITRYLEATNTEPKPFIWRKTADDILTTIARFANESLTQDTRIKFHYENACIELDVASP
jgi:hypothetical protein